MITRLLSGVALLVMPFLLTGMINRVKSSWSGRKGPPLFQSLYDVLRLLRKTSVYSITATPLFRIAPWFVLLTAFAAGAVVPLLGSEPLVSFPFDFVWFVYAWALGRAMLMLAGMDTGSSFEGMGVAREATFSAVLEPALFLVIGALSLSSGAHTLHEILVPRFGSGDASIVIWSCCVAALFIVLQVETARLPIDDPNTHLELTMVHEVMVLDHSGADLAAIQWASALKLYVATAILATLLNPWAGTGDVVSTLASVGLCGAVAVAVGTVESLIARFKLRAIPRYIAVAVASGAVALLATAWRSGATP